MAETADSVTEDLVARTERYVTCLNDAAFECIVDPVMFTNIISCDGFKRLQPGPFTASDAVCFVLEPMALAMGGRLLVGNGRYTDAPTPSPLIQVASGARKTYVLEPISAANMVCSYNEGKIGKIACFFQSRRDVSAVDIATRQASGS